MAANKEQLEVINSTSDRILCLAGAGGGKTFTLIARISKLVEDGVKASEILALTFTNAAGAEMKERFEKANPGKEIPEFRTFHAFCYSILCKDPEIRTALGYDTIPQIASEEQEKSVEERAKIQCKLTLTKEQLKNREDLSKKDAFQADLYDKAVARLMRAENIITFDKLNNTVADLFASDHPATRPYKQQYKYIFADEFQDTDEFQIKFLNSFPTSNFCFVGDCLQNIYSFRGTSNEYIKALANSDDWNVIKLYTNYRSTRQICEYANKFSIRYADPSYRIEMQGIKDGERVITKLVDGPRKYEAIDKRDVQNVLDTIKGLEGTSAILCRTNKEVAAVVSYLQSQGVDCTTTTDATTPHILECAVSETYMRDWLASLLSSNKYGEYIRLSAQVPNPDLHWFLQNYGNCSQIKDLVTLINQLKYIATCFGFTNTKLKDAAELLHIKNIKETDQEYFGVAFLQYLKDAILEVKSSEIYVGTIHSVKGLEYDNVFVMNVGSYSFKLCNEDMKNLFYVAVTRAKNRLYIYELFDS